MSTAVLVAVVTGGSIAVVAMIWNAIDVVRLRRPSIPAVRLFFCGLAVFPEASSLLAA